MEMTSRKSDHLESGLRSLRPTATRHRRNLYPLNGSSGEEAPTIITAAQALAILREADRAAKTQAREEKA